GISQIFKLACGYFIIITLARGLGPEDYGTYGLIMSVLLWVEFSSRLGIPQTMAKLIPENERDSAKFEQTAIGLTLIISSLVFVLFFLAAPLLSDFFKMRDTTNLFRLAAIDIPLYTMYSVGSEILGGHRRFGINSLRVTIYAGTKALGILVLALGRLTVAGALVVHGASSAVALLFTLGQVSFRNIRPLAGYIRPIVTLALPMGLYTVGWLAIMHLDLWCLKIFGKAVPNEVYGFYVAATNIAKVPGVAAFSMTAVLIPSISKALGGNDYMRAKGYISGAFRFLAVLLLPSCTLIAVTAGDLMALLFSENYRSGGLYLSILVFGTGCALNFLATFCAILIGKGEAAIAAFITLAGVLVGILLNFLLVPKYAAAGAALAQLATISMGAVLAGNLVYKRFGCFMSFGTVVKVIVGTIAVMFGARVVPAEGYWILPKIIILLLCYGIVLVILGEIKRQDLQAFIIWRD
ncbi:MAG: oligosaccharide flippase family protein, partial [Desulfobacterales bacterium]